MRNPKFEDRTEHLRKIAQALVPDLVKAEMDFFLGIKLASKIGKDLILANNLIEPCIKRFPDRCYAVVLGKRRGPCGHDKPTAIVRFVKSGLIADARKDS